MRTLRTLFVPLFLMFGLFASSAVWATSTPPTHCTLEAPAGIQSGDVVRLHYTTDHATSGSIDHGVGNVTPIQADGLVPVVVSAGSTLFTMHVDGTSSSAECTAEAKFASDATPALVITSTKRIAGKYKVLGENENSGTDSRPYQVLVVKRLNPDVDGVDVNGNNDVDLNNRLGDTTTDITGVGRGFNEKLADFLSQNHGAVFGVLAETYTTAPDHAVETQGALTNGLFTVHVDLPAGNQTFRVAFHPYISTEEVAEQHSYFVAYRLTLKGAIVATSTAKPNASFLVRQRVEVPEAWLLERVVP